MKKTKKRGSVLIIVLSLSFILLFLSLLLLTLTFYNNLLSLKFEINPKAKATAEAGVYYALHKLRQSDTYKGTTEEIKIGDCTFTVVVEEVAVNKKQRKITSTGYYPNKKIASAKKTVQTIVELVKQPSLKWAGFGSEELTIEGDIIVDSYNSSDGLYNPFSRNKNGNLLSNGSIFIKGNSQIFGSINTGRMLTTIGNVYISGSTAPITSKVEIPVVDCSYQTPNANLKGISFKDPKLGSYDPATMVLKTTGQTQVYLAEGTYYFAKIELASNSELVCLGKVVIYCKGNFDAGNGNIYSLGNKPSNLTIYSEGLEVKFSGSKKFYGVVYAPLAKVTIVGGGEIFGCFVGKTLSNSGGTNIHYDESVQEFTPSCQAKVKVWSSKL